MSIWRRHCHHHPLGCAAVIAAGFVNRSVSSDNVSFSAQWKPDERTKEQKLRAIKPSNNYPSERTFDAFIESEELDGIVEYRPDLYSTLCDHKWHQWKDDLGKWVRIRDWKAYVRALDEIVLRR